MSLSYNEKIKKIDEKTRQLKEQKNKLLKTMKKEAEIEKQKRHLKIGSAIEQLFDTEIGERELNVLKNFLENHGEEIKYKIQNS